MNKCVDSAHVPIVIRWMFQLLVVTFTGDKSSPIMSPCSWTIIPRSLKMSLISVMSAWVKQHKEGWFMWKSSLTDLYLSVAMLVWTFDSYLYLQLPDGWLPLHDQPQVFFSDGLSLSLRLGITAGTNLGEIIIIIVLIITDIIIIMINDNKKWAYLRKAGTFPKLSSGCPPY